MSKIKIIVEIEKRTYELLKDKPDNIAEEIIANGTPLPKGHGRLVDENHVIAELVYRNNLLADNVKCGEVTKIFDSAVVVEADKEKGGAE